MPEAMLRTQVGIIGGGPAGLLLAHLLHRGGVESVVVEDRSRAHVMSRIRAGVLEQSSVELLRDCGLGQRMEGEGHVHEGVNLAFAGRTLRVDFRGLTGRAVTVYGQTEVTKDLYDAIDGDGVAVLDEAEEVVPAGVATDRPVVTFHRAGVDHRLECDYVAGCDGAHGISRGQIPDGVRRTYERTWPFGWLGILSRTPPVAEELIYANHPRGFALCSMRGPMLSRYYVQCPLGTNVDDWPDDRFWEELAARLPPGAAAGLVTGPSIEKSVTPLRSFVIEPLRYGRLFLAGDAGHVVPPTGAKGLNLALADVHVLAGALVDHYRRGSDTALDAYSDQALHRVWNAVRFSWWLTALMHRVDEHDDLNQRLQESELDFMSRSIAARTAFAENYVGLPFE